MQLRADDKKKATLVKCRYYIIARRKAGGMGEAMVYRVRLIVTLLPNPVRLSATSDKNPCFLGLSSPHGSD